MRLFQKTRQIRTSVAFFMRNRVSGVSAGTTRGCCAILREWYSRIMTERWEPKRKNRAWRGGGVEALSFSIASPEVARLAPSEPRRTPRSGTKPTITLPLSLTKCYNPK